MNDGNVSPGGARCASNVRSHAWGKVGVLRTPAAIVPDIPEPAVISRSRERLRLTDASLVAPPLIDGRSVTSDWSEHLTR
jgi:hypothetical protein